jgi:hypothetical protein
MSKASRLYIRCETAWLEEVGAAAAALGLDVSAYVTLAISERMQRDRLAESSERPKKCPSPPPQRKP